MIRPDFEHHSDAELSELPRREPSSPPATAGGLREPFAQIKQGGNLFVIALPNVVVCHFRTVKEAQDTVDAINRDAAAYAAEQVRHLQEQLDDADAQNGRVADEVDKLRQELQISKTYGNTCDQQILKLSTVVQSEREARDKDTHIIRAYAKEVSMFIKENKKLESEVAQLRQERDADRKEFMQMLEYCRTLLADGMTAVRKAVQSREWLTKGRGCYEWNDDNWHKEFAYAAKEILDAVAPFEKEAGNLYGCPQKWEEIVAARRNLRAELAKEREARERAEGALRGLRNEVHSMLGLAEPEMRQAVGSTNVNCLTNRLLEADKALAALKSSQDSNE